MGQFCEYLITVMSSPDIAALIYIITNVQRRIVNEPVGTDVVQVVVVVDKDVHVGVGRVAALLKHVAPRCLKSCAQLNNKYLSLSSYFLTNSL